MLGLADPAPCACSRAWSPRWAMLLPSLGTGCRDVHHNASCESLAADPESADGHAFLINLIVWPPRNIADTSKLEVTQILRRTRKLDPGVRDIPFKCPLPDPATLLI